MSRKLIENKPNKNEDVNKQKKDGSQATSNTINALIEQRLSNGVETSPCSSLDLRPPRLNSHPPETRPLESSKLLVYTEVLAQS